MKTRCPVCATVFRVTPVQLKARAGKVRCGQCQSVFDALDSLIDEADANDEARVAHDGAPAPITRAADPEAPATHPVVADPDRFDVTPDIPREPYLGETVETEPSDPPAEVEAAPLSEHAAKELGKVTGLILPRETTEIPGYSKWAEGVVSTPFSLPEDKTTRWPFVLAAVLLILLLAGQAVFHFRSEIAVAAPVTRPMLETLSRSLEVDLPLPRHVERVSIETSDLQADPARGNLLALNATLRNQANYAQAYPALELSLTDTADAAIARRVFLPDEYLPQTLPDRKAFAANGEIAVHLWIEAKDINAAGYRLYVFYP